MLFQKINREDGDKVFITCKNGEAFAINPGEPVCFSDTAADGNVVTRPLDRTRRMFAGIVGSVTMGTSGLHNAYQKVQAYGWNNAISVGFSTVNAGEPLVAKSGVTYLQVAVMHAASTAEAITEQFAFVIAGTTYAAPATTYLTNSHPGFIRAL